MTELAAGLPRFARNDAVGSWIADLRSQDKLNPICLNFLVAIIERKLA
jgi:hypothetical protein